VPSKAKGIFAEWFARFVLSLREKFSIRLDEGLTPAKGCGPQMAQIISGKSDPTGILILACRRAETVYPAAGGCNATAGRWNAGILQRFLEIAISIRKSENGNSRRYDGEDAGN
jgi:hypothetical protein